MKQLELFGIKSRKKTLYYCYQYQNELLLIMLKNDNIFFKKKEGI